ncbi:sporulation integral membrane protein YtvI [Bacillus changyiensis]|uniref:sporulation integral membrane protein YtvI n=1 Tax=Bacillus changyiensis TaxID=3004103 RepID=UPI0022E8B2E6|nr:sporulation integral membrane protein YtvI [Bacillus changyiensis]MDA1477585.1 sporulation integral membrane protein YtvI [Bacillus changyiensis]
MNQPYLAIAFRAGYVLLVIAAVGTAGYYSFSVIYPFLFALILAVIINPVVEWFEQRTGFSRGINVFIVLSGFLIAGFGLLTLIIAEIVSGTAYLAKMLPVQLNKIAIYSEAFFTNKIMPLYNQFATFFDGLEADQQESIIAQIQHLTSEITSSTASFLSIILESVSHFFAFLPNTVAALMISLLATFFISKDFHKLTNGIQVALPERLLVGARAVYIELKKALTGFLKAQLTLVGITMILVLIGLLLLQVNHAFTIAFFTGLIDLLPYLGAGSVFVPWILYLVLTKQLPLAISIGVLYIVVLLVRQLAEPKILSKSIGLHPLGALVALFAGFKLFGFFGLIIGPALFVVIQAFIHTGICKDVWLFIKGK